MRQIQLFLGNFTFASLFFSREREKRMDGILQIKSLVITKPMPNVIT